MRITLTLFFITAITHMSNAQTSVTAEQVQSELSKARAYTLVFLTTGTASGNDEKTAQKTQMEHLQYLFTLKENKHVSVFGPLTDNGNVRGIIIFNSTDHAEVKKLLDSDPHIKAGSLQYELHPWFGIPGQVLAGK